MENIQENAKILLVDDSKFARTVVKNTLLEIKMNVTECEDGQEAMNEIFANRYDLIIIDTVMPNMDGLTFIKEFKQNKRMPFTPVILMTGNEDVDSKIKGLNVGADDFLQKPVNQKELVARVFSLLRLKRMHSLLYQKNQLIKQEMKAAKKVQEFIIPKNFDYIDSPSISGFYLPMEDIGGDFYDCYKFKNGNVGMLIADVTGHGIPAALIVTMAKMIFNIYAPQCKSTQELFEIVNREVFQLLLDEQYLTSFYLIYNPEKKLLRFTNAGHVLPLYYRKRTGKIISLDTDKGFFIGILEQSFYSEKAIKVEEGDRLLLYTDGLTELKNSSKEEYGEKRLASYIKNNPELSGDEFCTSLYNDVLSFAKNKNRYDDISFLNIEF